MVQTRDGVGPASATEVAVAFVEAYANYDIDTAASYLAADVDLSNFDGSVEGTRGASRWEEASGFKVLLDSCEERITSAAGVSVRCTYNYHAIRSDEIGLGPYSGSWFDLTVQDGEIVSVRGNLVFIENRFSAEMWEPFADWVAENYPDDVIVMYTGLGQTMNRLTDESVALWEQRTREYVEYVKDSG